MNSEAEFLERGLLLNSEVISTHQNRTRKSQEATEGTREPEQLTESEDFVSTELSSTEHLQSSSCPSFSHSRITFALTFKVFHESEDHTVDDDGCDVEEERREDLEQDGGSLWEAFVPYSDKFHCITESQRVAHVVLRVQTEWVVEKGVNNLEEKELERLTSGGPTNIKVTIE